MGNRVAVIGGGIAGVGAAWALHRAGHEVSLWERRGVLGGNAKIHRWSDGVETGLSVLAWPTELFRNYTILLETIGVETVSTPPLRYFVRDGDTVFRTGAPAGFEDDLRGWDRLVAWVTRVNQRFDPGPMSLYRVVPQNPLNFTPLRWLARRFGVGDRFWERVFVPVHSTTFLTADLDGLPAFIAPVLEATVSFRHGARLETWAETSAPVFETLTAGFADRVHTDAEVARVERGPTVTLFVDGARVEVDAVVFACPAPAALSLLAETSALERMILGGVRYAEHTDPSFLHGRVHRDPSVLPTQHRDELLESFSNYVECQPRAGGMVYVNTFILSSWVPTRPNHDPRLVSYLYDGPLEGVEGEVHNPQAHPCLTGGNVARALMLRRIQGRGGAWFCSNWTTPGNGHDLSLLSGLVVADALGADYPFADAPDARDDFLALRRFMRG